jgi:hypothetical protein
MAKEGGSEVMTVVLVAGGGLAVYWYITNYGPNGAVSAGNASWWQTWFGGAPAQAAVPPATQPVMPLGPTNPTPINVPAVSALQIPTGFTVTADINNSVKGTVYINGQPVTLNVILPNIGQATGVVWNVQGQDVTQQLPAGVLGPLVKAYQDAATVLGLQGLKGIVPAFTAQGQPNLAGGLGIPSMSFGKGFGGGFSGKRKSTGPMSRLLVN